MSLNRTLDRFLTEIRREAKRNPAFAERMDAVFRAHQSGREVSEDVIEAVAVDGQAAGPVSPALPNPVGVLQKDGEEGLRALLGGEDVTLDALAVLIGEHNLDPAGASEGADKAALIEQVVAASARRIARDKKLFDY